MTKAIVKRGFRGVPDGDIKPRTFNPGDEVSGNLADVAMREGWAIPDEPLPVKEKKTVSVEIPGRSSQPDPVSTKRKRKKYTPRASKRASSTTDGG